MGPNILQHDDTARQVDLFFSFLFFFSVVVCSFLIFASFFSFFRADGSGDSGFESRSIGRGRGTIFRADERAREVSLNILRDIATRAGKVFFLLLSLCQGMSSAVWVTQRLMCVASQSCSLGSFQN